MSEDVSVLIRGNRGNPPAMMQVWPTAFSVQMDKMSFQEAVTYQGADPHFTYSGYTLQLPTTLPMLVRQNDMLIDQFVLDPLTGMTRIYRIISDPEPFPDGHWEWVCFLYRGGN